MAALLYVCKYSRKPGFLKKALHIPLHCRLFSQTREEKFTGIYVANKKHVKVGGKDSSNFLNGLVTNDVNLFYCDTQIRAMYCMMLNVKGRVLYDMFLYKLNDQQDFLLECDQDAMVNILKLFKMYKLRSEVDFTDVSGQYGTWVVTKENAFEYLSDHKSDSTTIMVKDPRLSVLGTRLVLPADKTPSLLYGDVRDSWDSGEYDTHRVRLGVGEGMKDIEPSVPLPLEYNITDLHGVSYQKGCYVGQELTARSHHTGVLRKRIMPLEFSCMVNTVKDVSVVTDSGKSAGKVKSVYGNIGLGLMRLETVKSAGSLSMVTNDGGTVSVTVNWPSWWVQN